MAITNSQQYKQLMQKGGRIGLRGGGQDAATESFAVSLGGGGKKGQAYADKVGMDLNMVFKMKLVEDIEVLNKLKEILKIELKHKKMK